jgi:Domain of unknown function (DUF892)
MNGPFSIGRPIAIVWLPPAAGAWFGAGLVVAIATKGPTSVILPGVGKPGLNLAKAAHSPELTKAFETHHDENQGRIERLEEIFELINMPARSKTCDAIVGILEEGKEVMEDFGDSPALDAGLLAGAQAVEHYEISRYGHS